MVDTRLSGSRPDDTLSRVEGLEKAVAELTAHVRSLDTSLDERILRCLEPILRELRGPRVAKTTPEVQSDMSGVHASEAHASRVIPTVAIPPAMALPSFDGTDALGWLARAGQYFMVNKTPDADRMDLALIALSGPALPWIQILRRRFPSLSWDKFSQELLIRFSDDSARDSYEALAATNHDGSLADYIAAFESHSAQLPDLTDHQFLGFFLAKLKSHIRLQLTDQGIATYSNAVQMAKRIELLTTPLTGPIKSDSGNISHHRYSMQHSSHPLQAHSRPPQHSASYSPNSSIVPISDAPNSTLPHSDSVSSSLGHRPNRRFINMS